MNRFCRPLELWEKIFKIEFYAGIFGISYITTPNGREPYYIQCLKAFRSRMRGRRQWKKTVNFVVLADNLFTSCVSNFMKYKAIHELLELRRDSTFDMSKACDRLKEISERKYENAIEIVKLMSSKERKELAILQIENLRANSLEELVSKKRYFDSHEETVPKRTKV
jgi:hypothetical protein